MANHSLVFLDASGFVDEDYQRLAVGKGYNSWDPIPGGPIEYLTSFAEGTTISLFNIQSHSSITPEKTTDPVILFSHIPLYRPDGRPCGPLREKGTIRPGVGIGYQNTLGKEATKRLLEMLRPRLILRYLFPLTPYHSTHSPTLQVGTITIIVNTCTRCRRLTAFRTKREKSQSNLFRWP